MNIKSLGAAYRIYLPTNLGVTCVFLRWNILEMASEQDAVNLQYLGFVQQPVELQENNELHREKVQWKSVFKNSRRPTIKQTSTDGDWALFVDS